MFRFEPIPYPLWRRRWPFLPDVAQPLLRSALKAFYPLEFDDEPPASAKAVAHFLTRWNLLPEKMDAPTARRALETDADLNAPPERALEAATAAAQTVDSPVRIPAQWEVMERVIVTFPIMYPALWDAHAQMIEAISPVAQVDVLVPARWWAAAVRLFLRERGRAKMDNVCLLLLPTDDIWVRDYGPIVGLNDAGDRVTLSATYDPLPNYPQARDNAMPERYAAYHGLPVRALDLHTEGGNLWSDGAGTLLMTNDLFQRNPHLDREAVIDRLRETIRFEKLIFTPSLAREETGHIDLLVKLVDARTVLVSAGQLAFGNTERLQEAAAIFERETNAAGEPYRVIRLPAPPIYANWFAYLIFRSYTNALTVNGRVLVPIYGAREDALALNIYREAMPEHDIIPIDCRYAANGGGAVHCLTKEIPAAQEKPKRGRRRKG